MIGGAAAKLASREVGLLSVMLTAALSLRLLGVGRGLPYLHEWDEPTVLMYVIGMLKRGDLYPGVFVYPSVYYYLLLPVMYLHYWYLHAHGVLSSPWGIRVYHPQAPTTYWWYMSPASFYLWGRVLTTLVGTATVYVVYRVGKTVYGTAAGLLAAAFLALAPGAVYYSDTVRVDIPMTFMVTLTVLAGLRIIRHGTWPDYLLTGLLGGLAASTKTNAVVVVLPLIIAHILGVRRASPVVGAHRMDLHLLTLGGCMLAGFVIGTPYVVIEPKIVLGQFRDQAAAYGGIPSLDLMRRALPGYLAYFAGPSQGDEWYVVPHSAIGVVPAIAALVGAAAGFAWNRRLHLYLLSFPVAYFFFMSGQTLIGLRNMMAVLPFAALFAAVACVSAWRLLQQWWPAAHGTAARTLAGLALVALLAAPGREAAALGWTMGHRPDTRAAAVAWLRQHVAPGTRVVFEEDLRWYIPDLNSLPFDLRFAPRNAALAWYLQQRVDVAVVGDRSPLRSLPALAVFRRPPYEPRAGDDQWPQDSYPVIDPALYVVRPRMPEVQAVFPATVEPRNMILEPPVTRGAGAYAETVRLPDQRFTPGSYTLTVTVGPRSSAVPTESLRAEVVIGRRTVGAAAIAGTGPLQFTTPAFRIDETQVLPVQIDLTVSIPQGPPEQMGALRPPAGGCATAPDAPALNLQRLTVEAWVYAEGMNEPPEMRERGLESENPIVSKRNHEGYYLRLVGDAADNIYADLSVAGRFSAGRAGSVPLRMWTHVAATYDGREARVYVNGRSARPVRDPHHEGAVHAEGAPLVVGCRHPGTPDQLVFIGAINRVRIWNTVLSPDAIWREAGSHPFPDPSAGLAGSWSFQSLVGGAVPDLSGGGHPLAAGSLAHVTVEADPAMVRPEWMSRGVNLLRRVTINRTAP